MMAALNTMGEKIYIDIIGEKTRSGMSNSTYKYCGGRGEAEQIGAWFLRVKWRWDLPDKIMKLYKLIGKL